MNQTLVRLWCLLFPAIIMLTAQVTAQPPHSTKMQKKIEDLRKIKLLDILELQGDQVEKFFSVYNKHQKNFESLREQLMQKSADLQASMEKNDKPETFTAKADELRKLIREMGKSIDARFDDVKTVLTPLQYAKYVVFETRFKEELQQRILDRVRQKRKDR